MLRINPISLKIRLKELLIDYIFIVFYLLLLFCFTMLYYHYFLNYIPKFSEIQSQLVATFFSVIPIIIIFSFLDDHRGSIGKQKTGLKLVYLHHTPINSLLRNIVKFLPWQIGHISTIRGIYTNYDFLSIILSILSVMLLVIMLSMGLFRNDKRHLADFIAGTQVQTKKTSK